MTTPQGTKPRTVRSQRAQRKAENRLGHGIVAYSTAAVKQAFVQGNWDEALAGLTACIRERQPWALRAWLEAAGAIGAEQRVVVALVQQFGARDEAELRELVDQGRKLKRLSENAAGSHEEWLASSMRLLKFLLREHPEWRVRVMSELSSGAVEVDESRPASGLNEPKQNGRVGTPIPPAKRNGGNDASFGTGANEGNEQATEDG